MSCILDRSILLLSLIISVTVADVGVGAVLVDTAPFPQGCLVHLRYDSWNHLEERLLDQAQARASYTPLFWGHSRSIPQGMILDVQPLVKSLFCPIRPSPNGFFDCEPLSPNTGYHFFKGVGGWGGGRGSKVFAQKAPSSGEAYRYHITAGQMVTQPMQSFRSGVRILVGRLLAAAAAPYSPDRGSNRRPKRLRSAALPFGHCLV